ncbi:MAG: hypothetical protein QOF25_4813 [Mycobacterium sp.]|jgi:DNA-binding IclR family transcriptional regulator|nr:hypothetical protein [Mycobacterium sp.]
MTLTQIAEGCGMQASKVHRYLASEYLADLRDRTNTR